MREKLAAAVCAALIAGASASAALAGEVIGPPGTPGVLGSGSQTDTQAVAHANSICAFSGLNDFRFLNGQIDTITQTPKDGPPGAPGHGTCARGTNPENPPSG
jgi:hypothetical protein